MSTVVSKSLRQKAYRELHRSVDDRSEIAPQAGKELPLFDSICGEAGLAAGWVRVQARSPLPGGDGISVAVWSASSQARLVLLCASLYAGTYHPGPVRHFTLPKKHGGQRNLGLPSVADRVVQSSALIALDSVFEAEFEDSSFGYRRGRSVKAAAERIASLYRQGFRHVVEADVLSFFENVPHQPLLAELEALLDEPPLIALFAQWLDMAGTGDTGLLQGAPISPLLANLYLDSLDEAVAGHDARIVRFADDFVILTRSKQAAERNLVRISVLLRERGLVLNPAKTRITDFDHGFEFLGRRFLKGFVLDGAETDDEDDWDTTLAKALPHEMSDQSEPVSQPVRQFRNRALEDSPALPSRPIPAQRIRALAPRQRALHLYGKGRLLDCRDNCFSVEEAGEEIWLCGADRIDRIDIGPQARVSEAALRFALATGTQIAFVDGRGMVQGRVEAAGPGRASLHLAQAGHIVDQAKNLALARTFVAGKIFNQRSVCQRWRNNSLKSLRQESGSSKRHQAIIDGVEARLDRMRHLVAQTATANDIHVLLGIEGEASKICLQIFRLALRGWTMERRQRRPAPDAANAVLNWLSHLVAREVDTALGRRGLHTGFGHLHTAEDGRASLAFDLMEELRGPLVEAQALTLFNTGELQIGHFFEPLDGKSRIWMTPDGSQRVIRCHERLMEQERLVHADCEGKTGWRGVIDAQIGRLVDHYQGGKPYIPYHAKA